MSKIVDILKLDLGYLLRVLLRYLFKRYREHPELLGGRRLSRRNFIALLRELQLGIKCNLPLSEVLRQTTIYVNIRLFKPVNLAFAFLLILALFIDELLTAINPALFFILFVFLILLPVVSQYSLLKSKRLWYMLILLLFYFCILLYTILKYGSLKIDYEVFTIIIIFTIIWILNDLLQIRKFQFKSSYILNDIARDIEHGQPLSDVLRKNLKNITPFHYEIFKIAEQSGKLNEVLGLLIDYEKTSLLFSSRKFIYYLKYPLFLIFFSFTISSFIVWKIAPKCETIFEQLGVEFPNITKTFIRVHHYFSLDFILSQDFWWQNLYVSLIVVALIAIFLLYFIHYFPTFLHFIPVISRVHRRRLTARICLLLGVTLQAGLTFQQLLKTHLQIFKRDLVAKHQFQTILQRLINGENVSAVLGESSIVPSEARALLALTSKTASFPWELINIARDQIQTATYELQRIATYAEPVSHLIGVSIVFFTVFSIYIALFSIPLHFLR